MIQCKARFTMQRREQSTERTEGREANATVHSGARQNAWADMKVDVYAG